MRCQALLASLYGAGLLGGCGRVAFEPIDEVSIEIHGVDPVPTIALTEGTACVVRTSGDLWCWGGNYAGEVGNGTYDPVPLPFQIGEPGSWSRVTAGMDHVCALDLSGRVFCWGSNGAASELGLGDYDERLAPTRVPVPATVIAIASGSGTTQALTATGARWGWGDNRSDGAIGNGSDLGPVVSPVPGLGAGWAQITTGDDHGCGLDTERSLWCWGEASIGDGTLASHFDPIHLVAGMHWLAVSASYQTCAIRDDGALYCWGSNGNGELGDGTTTDALVPIAIATGQRWTAVATAVGVTCAIRDDASLWCTGDNSQGQLGVGDKTDRHVLTEVMPGSRWIAVDISTYFGYACGIQQDETVYCWGLGTSGQLGQGPDLTSHLTPVPVMIPLS